GRDPARPPAPPPARAVSPPPRLRAARPPSCRRWVPRNRGGPSARRRRSSRPALAAPAPRGSAPSGARTRRARAPRVRPPPELARASLVALPCDDPLGDGRGQVAHAALLAHAVTIGRPGDGG